MPSTARTVVNGITFVKIDIPGDFGIPGCQWRLLRSEESPRVVINKRLHCSGDRCNTLVSEPVRTYGASYVTRRPSSYYMVARLRTICIVVIKIYYSNIFGDYIKWDLYSLLPKYWNSLKRIVFGASSFDLVPRFQILWLMYTYPTFLLKKVRFCKRF